MKAKLLTTVSLLVYQIGFSQTEKLLNGKVISQNSDLKDVEVINKTAKTSTRTNALGEFSILVRPKDSLIFFSKDYYFRRLKIYQENIDENNLLVNMILRPEELDEVVIKNIKFPYVGPADENSFVVPSASLDRYTGVYNGSIPNGINFIAVGESVFNLFRKKDEKAKRKSKTPELDFKKLVEATVPLAFFTNDLKLNPDEKELFVDFCDADPYSVTILKQKNLLYTMDYLYSKNDEFKKLKTEPKN